MLLLLVAGSCSEATSLLRTCAATCGCSSTA